MAFATVYFLSTSVLGFWWQLNVIIKTSRFWHNWFSRSFYTVKCMKQCWYDICIVKKLHFPKKVRLFHVFMSHSHRILILIVRSDKNGNFLREVPEALHVMHAIHQTTCHSLARSFLYALAFTPSRSDARLLRNCTGIPPVFDTISHVLPISHLVFNM